MKKFSVYIKIILRQEEVKYANSGKNPEIAKLYKLNNRNTRGIAASETL